MRKRSLVPLLLLLSCASIPRPLPMFDDSIELVAENVVSTAASEVRMTISPDGNRMLWGTIGRSGGAGGFDIFERVREKGKWGEPHPVSFNTSDNDFDPSFAPDGSGVYFFSNRAGGFGKDDLYFVPFDGVAYGTAVNLGDGVNTAGDEWAPVLNGRGDTLLYSTDGRGGKGKHDLFIARRQNGAWATVRPLDEINGPQEDFDATFLHDDRTIVLTSGDFEGRVDLYITQLRAEHWTQPVRLPPSINSQIEGAWNLGPSISRSEPGVLYFTSHHEKNAGRTDIYRVRYRR